VTLKVSRRRGLEVVVPEGFDHQMLPQILTSRQTWIDGQLRRFESLPGRFDENWPPQQVSLNAVGVTFDLSYREVAGNRLNLTQNGTEVEITHPSRVDDESFVKLFASYSKLVVRGQKTRWGSYSSRGTLSLNYKLMFLPEQLLRHVILHELSHSVHMNHSQDFWHLLNTLDPDTSLHDKQLSEAWKFLPAWLD